MKKLFFLVLFLIGACSELDYKEQPAIIIDTYSYLAGETITIKTEKASEYENVTISLLNDLQEVVDIYPTRPINDTYIINRSFYTSSMIQFSGRYYLAARFFNDEDEYYTDIPITLEPSVLIESICHSDDCNTISGNVIEQLPQKINVRSVGSKTIKFIYTILSRNNTYQEIHEFDSPTDFDSLSNIVFERVDEGYSAYIGGIQIDAYDIDGNHTSNSIPLKIVRPIEIRYDGSYTKAQVYQSVPVSGCIPGSIDTRVTYSESTSETRQNSASVSLSTSISNSNANSISQSLSEGITVSNTESLSISNTDTNNENFSENYSSTDTTSDANNIGFTSDDGENWSWSVNNSESSTNSSSAANNINGQVSGAVTTGVSGEGSLPFLAKATGKVETTVGVTAGIGRTTTEGNSNSVGENRGYSMSGNSSEGRSWGSVTSESSSQSIGGAYALGRSSSSSSSQGSSQSSARVWNLSEGVSQSNTVTVGDSESINRTIVDSSSSSTTFSFSGYIPYRKYGMFYRQTTRWLKRSEIVTYDVNGFPTASGFIDMNEWSWAPELVIDSSCENIRSQNSNAQCFIEPCF